jgi:hypothetical protein
MEIEIEGTGMILYVASILTCQQQIHSIVVN